MYNMAKNVACNIATLLIGILGDPKPCNWARKGIVVRPSFLTNVGCVTLVLAAVSNFAKICC